MSLKVEVREGRKRGQEKPDKYGQKVEATGRRGHEKAGRSQT